MKKGVAKFDAGLRPPGRDYKPVKPQKGRAILKGKEYWLHDGYDFDHLSAIFSPVKKGGKK